MDEITQFKLQQVQQLIDIQEEKMEGHGDDFENPAPIAIRWVLDQLVCIRDELEGERVDI